MRDEIDAEIKALIDADTEDQMRGQIVRCRAHAELYGIRHYLSMWDSDEHEAQVAVEYLADPDAAEATIAARYFETYGQPIPGDQAELGGEYLVPGAQKIAAAEKFASRSR
jgi:hypothetical protein